MLKLAIVGRPNVGKSALFNHICKRRIAIIDEAEGTTRDRLYALSERYHFPFQVIDTGGVDPAADDRFQKGIRSQTESAIQEADSLILVVDSRVGITERDFLLAQFLLKTGKPLVLAVNKIDTYDHDPLIHQFYKLGIQKMVGISALQGHNIEELVIAAWEHLSEIPQEPPVPPGIKISLIGRPNVGKSTLLNSLVNEERCLVSDVPGTTRDSVDVAFTFQGTPYVLIDTAGIRRKKAEHERVDHFAGIRRERAISRSDVVLLMLDVREGLTSQEKIIARMIEAEGKGCIVLVNKWDLVKGFRMEHCLEGIRRQSAFLAHCPLLFISALTTRNLSKIFAEVDKVYQASQTRITTHLLNKCIERAIQMTHPPMITGKRLRIYYLTQVGVHPPHFVLFVNDPELMTEGYKKYLIHQLREQFGFPGTPLLFSVRGKGERAPSTQDLAEEFSSPVSCVED